jgi:hypothetical protein
MQILFRYRRRRCLRFHRKIALLVGMPTERFMHAISIAGRYCEMDDGGGVECEPGARHDDDSPILAGGRGVSPDFAPIELAPEFDAGMSRLAERESLIECHAAIGVGAYRLFLSWFSA